MNNLSMVDDTRIKSIRELVTPAELITKIPLKKDTAKFIANSRDIISNIINFRDPRMVVFVWPCSIHNVEEAKEYARYLLSLKAKYPNLHIIMRVYLEKPRTTGWWKWLINDPDLDNSCNGNKGLEMARRLLMDINEMWLWVAVEFLDTITPQYISDTVHWWAILARTTESQEHRKLVSGASMPVAFKNGTNGDIDVAINSILSSHQSHIFHSITKSWHVAEVITTGNPDSYILMRGGTKYDHKNYDKKSIQLVLEKLKAEKIKTGIWIDFSHGHSINPDTGKKEAINQLKVCADVSAQIASGSSWIVMAMMESTLNWWSYKFDAGKDDPREIPEHTSITDEWVNQYLTDSMLSQLNEAVWKRMSL